MASLDASWPHISATPGAFPMSPRSEQDFPVISALLSLSQAVKARQSEYVRKKTIKIKVGSWNVAAIKGTERDLGAWFVGGLGVKGLSEDLAGLAVESGRAGGPEEQNIESVEVQEQRQKKKKQTIPKNDIPAVPHGDEIGLYVLGLQETVDVASATETIRQYTDTQSIGKWRRVMTANLPEGYIKIAEQQLLGLLLLIYASSEVAPTITSVSTTSVGTGLFGYMGNKGAASARIVLGETTRLVFVNCHLSAGSDKVSLERRNWDYSQILSRTKFSPVSNGDEVFEEFGESIGDEDFAFWFGDLNYRLADIPGDDVRRLLLLHTRNEYDILNKSKRKIDSELGFIDVPSSESSSEDNEVDTPVSSLFDPSQNPASLQTTLQSLLPHDELKLQQKLRKAFHHGWREGDINFLPTYKYDVGSVGMFDSGEKKRGPSWCDRILYRTRRDILESDRLAKQEEEARNRDAEMKARGIDQAASEDDVLFDYDPDTDGVVDGEDHDESNDTTADPIPIQTQEGFEDCISLDHYISHQRVLSSDHKPLDAVFTLTYDSVIPELKAKVHQEVARALDKAENEGRPGITLVVDNASHHDAFKTADESAESTSDLNGANFGSVRYGVKKSCNMTIANTGRVPATFCFIDRPVADDQSGGIAPLWLHLKLEGEQNGIEPDMNGLLPPGETTTIEISIYVSDFELAYALNSGKANLDDTLVLRVYDGRDHFIPVHGKWLPSCFGQTLDRLTERADSSIRSQTEVLTHGGEVSPDTPTARVSAPRELFALTEGIQDLVERAVAEWDMTNEGQAPPWSKGESSAGWPFEPTTWTLPAGAPDRMELCAGVREALDTSSAIAEHFPSETNSLLRLEILAETLVMFLRSLRDGIVTSSVWPELEAQRLAQEKTKVRPANEDKQASIIEAISSQSVHSVAFTFLTFMITRIANEIAPLPSPTLHSPRMSRTSRSSTESTPSEVDVAPPSTGQSPGKASLFSPFKRRARKSTSSTSDEDPEVTARLARRREVERTLTKIFAEVMVRTGDPVPAKEKERRVLEERKMAVLEPFVCLT
jgi:inositol polyphosphate 5-phosphatase INPP5B/F